MMRVAAILAALTAFGAAAHYYTTWHREDAAVDALREARINQIQQSDLDEETKQQLTEETNSETPDDLRRRALDGRMFLD